MNEEYALATYEGYIPQECEYYGFNETGGLDADGKPHCDHYLDKMTTNAKY